MVYYSTPPKHSIETVFTDREIEFYMLKAMDAVKTDNYDAALQLIKEARVRADSTTLAKYEAGCFAMKHGNYAKAVESFLKAFQQEDNVVIASCIRPAAIRAYRYDSLKPVND
jgi:lipopolysaccharide biosynthesis regulator YciM